MIFAPSSFIRLSEPIARGTVTGQRNSRTRLRASCPTSRTSEHSRAGARRCDVRMFGCLSLDGPYREGGNSVLETILKLFLQQVAVPFEKLQSGVVADVKPDRAKCLGFGLTDHSPNPKIAVIILSMRSCMSQICWWISECSSVSISAARRSSSSAAFRLRVSSGNSSALRRRQVLDRLECRGWVVVRVPSALQPSLAGSSEQAQKLNSLPRMPTRPICAQQRLICSRTGCGLA